MLIDRPSRLDPTLDPPLRQQLLRTDIKAMLLGKGAGLGRPGRITFEGAHELDAKRFDSRGWRIVAISSATQKTLGQERTLWGRMI